MSQDQIFNASSAIRLTTDVVCSYVARNHVAAAELPSLMTAVHDALLRLMKGEAAAPAQEATEHATPHQIRKSITPDGLISFIDGKPYKTIKRHLTKHGFTPETYRAHFGLPHDYPTVSANYSERRSALARDLGLGQRAQLAVQEASPTPTKGKGPAARKLIAAE